MDFPKFCHFLGKTGHIPGFSTANSYLTSQFFIPILKFLLCFFRQSHNLLCPPLQKHAVICQRHMVFSPVKKLNSQFFLQLDQLPGKRGLCDVKEPGCFVIFSSLATIRKYFKTRSSISLLLLSLSLLFIFQIASCFMRIYYAYRLKIGINNSRSHKLHTSFLQILGYRI